MRFLILLITTSIFFASFAKNEVVKPEDTAINYKAAYVVNGTGNSISVIDLVTNEVKKTIALNNVSFPHHIAISPNKSQIAIGIPGMNLSNGHSGLMTGMPEKFLILNALTGELIKSQSLPTMCHNAIFSPSGTEIWQLKWKIWERYWFMMQPPLH
jgi:YVTN family beta-propeller protein